MNVISLGAKNAFRNATRTLAVVLILGISLGLALVMLLSLNSVRSRVNQLSGSINNTVTVTPAGSFGGFGGGGNPLTAAQVAEIKATPNVTSVVASITDRLTNENQQSSGFGFGNGGSSGTTSLTSPIKPGGIARAFSNGGRGSFPTNFSLPVEIYGTTDPSNAATLSATSWRLVSGAEISPTSTKYVADVGAALASKNGLTVGSTFTAYKKTFTVVGIFKTNTTTGNAAVIVPLKVESTLKGTDGPTQAVATVNSIGNVASVTSHLESVLGSSVQVSSSQTNAQAIAASFSSIKTISLYSLIGALIAAAVILLMSMLMIVRDRRREIGIFKSFGSPNRAVVSLFVVEALVVSAIAGVFGLLLSLVLADPIIGALSNSATTTGGRTGGAPHGFGGGFGGGPPRLTAGGFGRVASQLHAALGASTVLYAVLAVVFIAVVGSAIPAFAIAKVRPAEVLRGE
jgi:putative ABC transport system permease protein